MIEEQNDANGGSARPYTPSSVALIKCNKIGNLIFNLDTIALPTSDAWPRARCWSSLVGIPFSFPMSSEGYVNSWDRSL